MTETLGKKWLTMAREHIDGEFYVMFSKSEGKEYSVIYRIASNRMYLLRIEDDETYLAVKAQLVAEGKIIEKEAVNKWREEQRKK
jgi:hypothetical protein